MSMQTNDSETNQVSNHFLLASGHNQMTQKNEELNDENKEVPQINSRSDENESDERIESQENMDTNQLEENESADQHMDAVWSQHTNHQQADDEMVTDASNSTSGRLYRRRARMNVLTLNTNQREEMTESLHFFLHWVLLDVTTSARSRGSYGFYSIIVYIHESYY